MKRTYILIAFALLTAACAALGTKKAAESDSANVHPSQIGLSKVAAEETAAPILFQWTATEPGETPRPSRPYATFPPTIPHGIADALPITDSDNACIDCHLDADQEAAPIPKSHYIDFRNAPGKPGKAMYGARYNCNACHVPQSGVQPLVDNRFGR